MRQISRLEVIETGARRRWTPEEKQRIVAESFGAPRIVSATARRHGLTIATGNDRDFKRPGLKVFNPFKELG